MIQKIGPKKIGAIVSDNAANISAARKAISLKYPNIMNLRFYDDLQVLSNTLLPIKNAILSLESKKTTLVNCMVHLFHIAAIVKNTSTVDYKAFRQACINIFNKRYKEFNDLQYLLAFFLHPAWKDGRVKDEMFLQLSTAAATLWKF
uniref:DUF659 domain-containing protein n=2 Tax=Rhizophagus irregularis TaxID=588596 RepID=U9UN57_RHIID